MKKLIILGLNSDLGNKVEDYFSSLYSEVIRLSINNQEKWFLNIDKSDEFDIIDCHVYSGKHDKLAYTKLHDLLSNNTRCYICISTNMHGKDKNLFLSSYRKFKLQQEKFLLSLFGKKLVVIRSYDILDSKNWESIKDSNSVYKLSGMTSKQINIFGLETRDLLEWI
ncbi:hypothetical protein, partial [Vibrio splendidus]|uniref:hypothetical protein n=1 Tax=Vibrio splendidus TaxID=29497 RepID=UPI003D1306DE